MRVTDVGKGGMNVASEACILKLGLAAPAAGERREGGLGVSHHPAMKPESPRAASPRSPPPHAAIPTKVL